MSQFRKYFIEEVLNFTVKNIQNQNKWICDADKSEFTVFDKCIDMIFFEKLRERENEKLI